MNRTASSNSAPSALRLGSGEVFMCSGQGSQKPGMGADLLDIPEVAQVFSCASDVFGFDAAALVAHAPAVELDDTRKAQAAVCTLSVAIARALMAHGARPTALLGFSLGQIGALALAGMVSDEVAFSIVRERSGFMAEAARENPGAMSALLKADDESVAALCAECARGDVLVPANYNCPGQIVVSGTVAAVSRAEEVWAARGGRFSRLAASGAFHSPLMEPAVAPFSAFIESVRFEEPEVPLICNVDARPLSAADAPAHLAAHLTHPVRFSASVEFLIRAGACEFVETGFGGVLANLVRRIDKNTVRACVQDRASLDAFLAARATRPFPEREETSHVE